jgi:hypothetical protein
MCGRPGGSDDAAWLLEKEGPQPSVREVAAECGINPRTCEAPLANLQGPSINSFRKEKECEYNCNDEMESRGLAAP